MIKVITLILTNFRNFSIKKLEFSKDIILFCGANGAGKTNILESLTLLAKGTSLRSADFDQMVNQDAKEFTIYTDLENHEFIDNIAISFNKLQGKKNTAVNGEIISQTRQSDLRNHFINFIALTPKLEQLFISSKSTRRDYLDKIVQDIDSTHQSRVSNYQKLLKERLLILQKYQHANSNLSDKWLGSIETKIVENAVAIAAARNEVVEFFNKAILNFSSNFPKPQLLVIGDVEELIKTKSALQLEEIYKEKLKNNRTQDLSNFKTNFGVHRSDFDALFDKNSKLISATLCSTGEQKAIMIGITLARGKISANYRSQPTIMIFDEVVAHLDDDRKINLLTEIQEANLQSFLSATNKDLIPPKSLKNIEVITL
ncbi:MAG: AAA family ATPase [Rickettsiales bacterium]|nr:AAA family ATPase [Rickettsiales bacterium]